MIFFFAVLNNAILPCPTEIVRSNNATITLQLNPDIDVANDDIFRYNASGDGHTVSGGYDNVTNIRQVGFKFSIPLYGPFQIDTYWSL